MERGKLYHGANRKDASQWKGEVESRETWYSDRYTRSSEEVAVMAMERRGVII